MAQCLNVEDGSTLFRERYESRDRVYASLVLGDGRLYAQLRDGTYCHGGRSEYTISLRINWGMEMNNFTHPHLTKAVLSSVHQSRLLRWQRETLNLALGLLAVKHVPTYPSCYFLSAGCLVCSRTANAFLHR